MSQSEGQSYNPAQMSVTPPTGQTPTTYSSQSYPTAVPPNTANTSQISPTYSGPAQRSLQSADGQQHELYPNQIQMSGQPSYSYPAQSQPQPQYQMTAQPNQWQPNPPSGQSPAPVVYVVEQSDPNAESKRMAYKVCRIIQLVSCAIALVVLFLCLILFLFVFKEFDDASKDFQDKFQKMGTSTLPPEIPKVKGWFAAGSTVMLIMIAITALVPLCGLIGAGGHVICCQVTHTVMTIGLFPYCVVPIVLTIGMFGDWNREPQTGQSAQQQQQKRF